MTRAIDTNTIEVHTAGNWFWSNRTLRSEIMVTDAEGDDYVESTPDILHVDRDKCIYASEADKRLIENAPEMLRELKAIGHQTQITTGHFNRLQRLIQRIEGL
jgi:hypothetical protein